MPSEVGYGKNEKAKEWGKRWVSPTLRLLGELRVFPTNQEMTRTGSATVPMASRALTKVAVEQITLSVDTAEAIRSIKNLGGDARL